MLLIKEKLRLKKILQTYTEYFGNQDDIICLQPPLNNENLQ